MGKNEMTPAVPATETKHLTPVQFDALKKQNLDLTPEEVGNVESLMASGVELKNGELTVTGGVALSQRMKKAILVAAAAGAVGAVGFGGYEGFKHKDKISGFVKDKLGKFGLGNSCEDSDEGPKERTP